MEGCRQALRKNELAFIWCRLLYVKTIFMHIMSMAFIWSNIEKKTFDKSKATMLAVKNEVTLQRSIPLGPPDGFSADLIMYERVEVTSHYTSTHAEGLVFLCPFS